MLHLLHDCPTAWVSYHARLYKKTIAVSLIAAGITATLVSVILALHGADFRLPLNYLKDANVFLVRAKAIVEGNWVWRNPRLGMPFGANWIDFPMNVTIDSGIMWILSRFTSSAPLIVNLDWVIELAITAGFAAYAFVRIGFGNALAVCCAIIFALQPYEWLGPKVLHCLPGAVPLVAAAAIEILRGRLRRVPAFAWLGCVWAGLSYVYVAFFSCVVLICAAALAWFLRRERAGLVAGLLLTGCIGAVALADLAPTLVYRARNGPNAAMLFKSPAEGEVYGLRFRYLLTPSPDHPLHFVRALEQRLATTKYPPIENENEYTRLGTVGSIGLVCLLGLLAGAVIRPEWAKRAAGSVLGPCAALTLVCILFATTGGLSVFFDTLVTPEIRAWARMFPFIGFFCVAAVGALAARLRNAAVLAVITLLAVFDQAMPSRAYDHSDAVYRQDGDFVSAIEKVLSAGSAVFELPYVDFPNDNHPGKLLVNDMLRPYLHSAKYRWSAGAVSGMTSAEWNRMAAALPVPEMLNAVVHRGFAGLWVDRAGYDSLPEQELTREAGVEPVRDRTGRFLFYDLTSYAGRVIGAEARNPVQAVFERGFYFAESGAGGVFRWSLRRGRITLVNPLPVMRRVAITMRIATADGREHTVRVGNDRVQAPGVYQGQVDVPPSGRSRLDLVCDCPGVRTENRTIYFYVTGLAVRE